MPYLHVHTNVAVADKADFLQQCSQTVATALGKPESYVMVELSDARPMLFAGVDAPLAFVELKSLGLPESRTAALSATICELLGELLAVPAGRIYIDFAAPKPAMFGWNGGTF